MNIQQRILESLLARPGMTKGAIAKATGVPAKLLAGRLCSMAAAGDISSDEKCRYTVVHALGTQDAKYAELSALAESLEKRSLWRRAATVWLKAFDATSKPALRLRAVNRHGQCQLMGSLRCKDYSGIAYGKIFEQQRTWKESE